MKAELPHSGRERAVRSEFALIERLAVSVYLDGLIDFDKTG